MSMELLIDLLTRIRDRVDALYGRDAEELINLIQDLIDRIQEEVQA